ncbi:hypothetical protein AZE42_00181 [Rhizopogon vesiculosus]|uniref:Uncharacterized protein n=1 Tax=Rhizopogon vesiculosus TaxID=180088 RepID=A0A1J8QUV6_9AGAM|nr:hypothetical protein AZE42_00181 [Rhizopogon vesiculosus]
MSAPSGSNDLLRDELDRLHQMLKEKRAHCAEARARLEARVVTEKDRDAERDHDFMEIRGKLHSLMDHNPRENKTSADASTELLLEASRQAHHESLAAIVDFAEGKADPTSSASQTLIDDAIIRAPGAMPSST